VDVLHSTNIDHPDSVALRSGTNITISERLGVTESGELAPGGFEGQYLQALANLETALTGTGEGHGDVKRVTVYLLSSEDRDVLNRIYFELFADPRPTRSCIGAEWLPYGGEVELEATARLGEPDSVLPWGHK
jgi:enamine deaminase RidA (YjgF/YER057c/UK114 family)